MFDPFRVELSKGFFTVGVAHGTGWEEDTALRGRTMFDPFRVEFSKESLTVGVAHGYSL